MGEKLVNAQSRLRMKGGFIEKYRRRRKKSLKSKLENLHLFVECDVEYLRRYFRNRLMNLRKNGFVKSFSAREWRNRLKMLNVSLRIA